MKFALAAGCHHNPNPLLNIRKIKPCFLKPYSYIWIECDDTENNKCRGFSESWTAKLVPELYNYKGRHQSICLSEELCKLYMYVFQN